jgi:hypothetical protein
MIKAAGLVRDSYSSAVLNTDLAALNKYKKERELYRKVSSLTAELETVKQCLTSICEKLEKIESK